uniref:FAD synthase middle domain-containing protein n=1 Tax=Compsopogon caeruleus TaxID=31354 RepID=A0A7S1TF34_9RHOD|mmetsp:Transcript_4385/g.8642  ORF Transcript_4385/g.8642 Transcript_4385/m.8642 type:complete len:161 (+) Transcript_4385:128-610(+)
METIELMRKLQPDVPLNDARKRMAIIPTSPAVRIIRTPGLWVPLVVLRDTVYILPGVPFVFEKMIDHVVDTMGLTSTGKTTAVVLTQLGEGDFADVLAEIAERNADRVAIGSYPRPNRDVLEYQVKVTIDGDDDTEVQRVAKEITEALNDIEKQKRAHSS